MLVAWRDGGFWSLLWLAGWLLLTGGRKNDLPPPGFVGQVCGSLVDIEPRNLRKGSMTLSRTLSTSPAPQWRLTCVWESSRRPLHPQSSGRSSAVVGVSPPGVGGVASSEIKRDLS